MGYRETLDLPIKTFWMLHKNVDRIAAEQDMRAASIAIQSQSSEGIRAMMSDLRKQMGIVFVTEQAVTLVKIDPARKARLNILGDLSTNVYPS
jgi:hypothetical protein